MPETSSSCDCPVRNGLQYHQRDTCTDPVVKKLDWYAASNGRPNDPAQPPPERTDPS